MQFGVKNNISRLQVSMNNLLLAKVFQSLHHLSCEVLDQGVGELLVLAQERVETALWTVFNEEVDLIILPESMVEFHNRRVVQIG